MHGSESDEHGRCAKVTEQTEHWVYARSIRESYNTTSLYGNDYLMDTSAIEAVVKE